MQEEELSVSEILSSIRQVLAKETAALNEEARKQKEQSNFQKKEPEISPLPAKKEEFVLELTPQMRVKQESLLSAQLSLNEPVKGQEPNCTAQQIEEEVKPFIKEWLSQNLADIVEKVVTQEVRRIIENE